MTHGRITKTRANRRTKRHDNPLTGIREKPTKTLENRVAKLEAKIAELEERVDRASGVVPAHFYGETDGTAKKKPGPKRKIDDTELLLNRDNLVYWLEEHWPRIVKPLRAAQNPGEVAMVLRQVATARDIRPSWQSCIVGHPARLFDFLQSEKFRIKPPRKTVIDSLLPLHSDKRSRAANRLPTRQIANAMAGVPKLEWRTSLDKCSLHPSSYRVGHNTAEHYRAMFGIPEDNAN
jgi:hypothetical protein